MSIKMYIDAGWYTVPLQGKLKRLGNGDKSTPIFPENFKDHYNTEFNKEDTELGGVMTGPGSDIIAIDCDSQEAYDLFRTLDPKYKTIMKSVGKLNANGSEIEAGTFIYKYHPDLEENFVVKTQEMKIDFYSTKGFIYLPTEANKTKKPWTEIPEIKEVPHTVLALLKSLKPRVVKQADIQLQGRKWINHLGPQVTQFVENKKVTEALFKMLTPRDFRDADEYIQKGYLHPSEVMQGRGSEYLSKISSILGSDESIDEELYSKAMYTINDLFDDPMPKKRIDSTIIEPMIEEKASIDGKVIWKYNKNWEHNLTNIVTKLNSSLTLFYDMARKYYYAIDTVDREVHEFKRDTDLFSFVDTVSADDVSKKELRSALPLVKVVSSPQYEFGFFGDAHESFNIFSPTIPLSIFKDPVLYKSNYNYPATIIKYFEYLIPDNYMRNYLFKFMRRKLDMFEYSPVILYFLGASGSGKDLFVSIVEHIMGGPAVGKPSAKEFLETHNGWLLDKYFIQLDEYGDQLSRFDEKELAKGKIKSLTGKPTVSLRLMRTDSFAYEHNATFIMTANKNPLTLDTDDRRVALFDTPQVLRFMPMVEEMGLETFVKKVFEEINDFVYWLAVERENATLEEYMTPPETADKQMLIAAKLNAGAQISYLLNNNLFKEFETLCDEYESLDTLALAGDGKIYEDDLFDLYMEMTEDQGTKRGLTMAMKGFDKIPTTKNGSKMYYYNIPNLRIYRPSKVKPIEDK